jgi:ubiquinol-cytochrome c reductase iron-sulfur subunit
MAASIGGIISVGEREVNGPRRRFLIGATSAVAGLGAVGVAVPFVQSWTPSAKARALGAPIRVDISKLEPGALLGPIPAWRGMPVFVIRRTEAMLAELAKLTAGSRLADPASSREEQQPAYAKNEARSRKAEIGVYVGTCTHLGCSPKFFGAVGAQPFDAQWVGGFFCPCHGSRFDLAGRVFANLPAPANLLVPPYSFESDTVIVIGVDEETA